MIPFLQEFHAAKNEQVRISTLVPGQHAIILSMTYPRALLIEITRVEGNWVHGLILAPDPHPDYNGPMHTFSREGNTWCTPLTPATTLDLLHKYHVSGPNTEAMIRKEIDSAQNVS